MLIKDFILRMNQMKVAQDFFRTRDFAVVDIETTGLRCQTDDIIEISAVKVENDIITDEYSSLVYTDKIIDPFIFGLTGINNAMLENAQELSTVLCELFDFVGNMTIVGHNIGFDMRFISWNSALLFGEKLTNNTLDSLLFSKEVLPDLKSHKLSYLKEYFGIGGASHRALDDCRTTYELVEILKKKCLDITV